MKHYKTLFDIFLFEGIFLFLFSSILTLLSDPVSDMLFLLSAGLFIAAVIMGIIGKLFHFFKKEPLYEEH